eukprot:scaffold1814_cov94-Cylindrotheca_fusiformis.AAC.3
MRKRASKRHLLSRWAGRVIITTTCKDEKGRPLPSRCPSKDPCVSSDNNSCTVSRIMTKKKALNGARDINHETAVKLVAIAGGRSLQKVSGSCISNNQAVTI